MKILYGRSTDLGQDYLSDTILHGLKSLANVETIDEPRQWYMYANEFGPSKRNLKEIYGRGFTIYGTLQDHHDNVDRSNVEEKIRAKYYDLIIFSRVDSGHMSPYLQLVFDHYPSNKIIFLDGEDGTNINSALLGKGLYFKRELTINNQYIIPISFSFPKEKIQTPLEKTQVFSQVRPTWGVYIHENEQDYYNDYRRSLFGITHKKGGWDCLRHYEILGSRSIPVFTDLPHCPKNICTHLPKDMLLNALTLVSTKSPDYFMTSEGIDVCRELENKIHNHFIEHCTTEAMAKYMLDYYLKYSK